MQDILMEFVKDRVDEEVGVAVSDAVSRTERNNEVRFLRNLMSTSHCDDAQATDAHS